MPDSFKIQPQDIELHVVHHIKLMDIRSLNYVMLSTHCHTECDTNISERASQAVSSVSSAVDQHRPLSNDCKTASNSTFYDAVS